ncbi:MAG TPA: hypothetical protein VHE55_06295 [Fimbriimonadaceae bacterium]|nr:hypothetical protein [Fimbriimonadaceae bacterium]
MLAALSLALSMASMRTSMLAVRKIDFVSSSPVTDRGQFYKDQSGNTQPAGNGLYPATEIDTQAPISYVPYLIYPRTHTSIAVQVTFYNPLSVQVSGTWWCDNADFIRETTFPFEELDFDVTQATHTITIPGQGTTTISLVLNGSPDCVCGGVMEFGISASCQDQSGSISIGGTGTYTGTMYWTDANPAGLMTTPWAEILNLSCSWADGCTSKEECLHYCTTGLYHSGMFSYNATVGNEGAPPWHIDTTVVGQDFGPTAGKYQLSRTFNQPDPKADCEDVSGFLSLCTAALGYPGTLTQVWLPDFDAPSDRDGIETTPLQPIGLSGFAAFSGETSWGFHQFLEDSSKVYDACAAQVKDLNGANYGEAPWGWPRSGYWQTSPPDTSDFLGLANGYRSWVQDSNGQGHYVDNVPASRTPTFVPAQLRGPARTEGIYLLRGIE